MFLYVGNMPQGIQDQRSRTVKNFLGIEVTHSKLDISLCQRKYCLNRLQDSKILCAKHVSTPSDPSAKHHKDNSSPYHDILAFRRLVGRLLYLNVVKSDISFCT